MRAEQRDTILLGLKAGLTRPAAASRAGIHRTTLSRAIKADDDLRDAVEQAEALAEAQLIASIRVASSQATETVETFDKAGNVTRRVTRGPDWRAAAWLLERHPAFREKYGPPKPGSIAADPPPMPQPVEFKPDPAWQATYLASIGDLPPEVADVMVPGAALGQKASVTSAPQTLGAGQVAAEFDGDDAPDGEHEGQPTGELPSEPVRRVRGDVGFIVDGPPDEPGRFVRLSQRVGLW